MHPIANSHPTVQLRPITVNLDWLTVNMVGPDADGVPWNVDQPVPWWEERDADEWIWVKPAGIATAQFRKVSYVVDAHGRKMATIAFEPHQHVHGQRWMQVQFANETLYDGSWTGIFRRLRWCGCTYTGISRVDIAADGIEGDGGDWPLVIGMASTGTVRYYGKCEWLVRTSRRTVVGAEFGTRSSNKFIRAYRKKREMKSKGIKPHIVDAWINALGWNPMDQPVEINRLEIQLKGKEIRRYFSGERDAEWMLNLSSPKNRVDVMASMAESMFDFRTVADRARDSVPVQSWDWSNIAPVQYHHREPRKHAVSDHTIKTHLRAMYHVGCVMGDQATLATAVHVAESAGPEMAAWYFRKQREWNRELAMIAKHGDARTMAYFNALQLQEN
jgi:hypothetical protein